MKNEKKTKEVVDSEEMITRKEALIKAGKYAAFTAVGMMIILSPKKSQATSENPEELGGRGW